MGFIPKLGGGGGGAALSDATPLAASRTGGAGTGTAASRSDHQHPSALKNLYSQFNPQNNLANTSLQSLAGPLVDNAHTYSQGTRKVLANTAIVGTQWDHEILGEVDVNVDSEIYHLQLLLGATAIMSIFPQADAGVSGNGMTFRLRISCMVQTAGASGLLNTSGDFFIFSSTGAIVARAGFFSSASIDFTQDQVFDFKQAFGTGTGETFLLGQWLIDQRN